jgi:hypothetical protein
VDIKGEIVYGVKGYPVEDFPLQWKSRMAAVMLDPEALAKLCYDFFGDRSGGYHNTVRKDGAYYSNSHGRVYIAGNGWRMTMMHDQRAWDRMQVRMSDLIVKKDFEAAGKLMGEGVFKQVAAPKAVPLTPRWRVASPGRATA